ncbi:MAG: SH3 domain-containing protein [Dehalococcoidia bacterium]|nr:SH3 domain-containing protein [Dehalococcoidia bacterium]
MTLRVKVDKLNVRSGPGTGYEIVAQLGFGDLVEPVETAGWLPVELGDGTVGWVAERYLEKLSESVDQDVQAIVEECRLQGLDLPAQIAYVLATVEWETNRTFKPVREAYWLSEDWRKLNLRYYPYYGRGYVQLTWGDNYRRYTERLRSRFPERAGQIDLVAEPDQALIPEYARFILVDGFKTGAFTGKKLPDYVNEDRTDFLNARRCINRLDRADKIASLAEKWLSRLEGRDGGSGENG